LNVLVLYVDKLIFKRVIYDVTNIVHIITRIISDVSDIVPSSSSTPKSNNLSSESFLEQSKFTGASAISLLEKSKLVVDIGALPYLPTAFNYYIIPSLLFIQFQIKIFILGKSL
jgi:hypothetical protein